MDKFLKGSKQQAVVKPTAPVDEEMKDESASAKPKFTPWIEK